MTRFKSIIPPFKNLDEIEISQQYLIVCLLSCRHTNLYDFRVLEKNSCSENFSSTDRSLSESVLNSRFRELDWTKRHNR